MKSYTANALNQYTSIANPDAVGLRGSATNTATVTVNGNAASRDSVVSTWTPWHHALSTDNANGGVFTFAEIMAVVNAPGTNTPDVVDSASGTVYAPPQNETLTYDDDGNLLSDGRFNYTWNGENRLVRAEEQVCPTNRTLRKVEYAYDHQGRMVWKKISHENTNTQSWSEEKAISYLWDDFNIIAETSVSDFATNTTYNIWGLDLNGTLQGAGGVGGLLAVVKDSFTYVPAWDANGNIMEYVDSDGTVVAHREYDPFGGTIVATGDANAFSHWFSTKPWYEVTGLSEYQYRKYSPVLGRWLSRDPIGEQGGINLYVLCFNRSVDKADFLGLATNVRVESFISEMDGRNWMVVRVQAMNVPQGCEINFIQFVHRGGKWIQDPQRPSEVPGFGFYYYDRAAKRYKGLQEFLYNKTANEGPTPGNKWTAKPEDTTIFVDGPTPTTGNKLHFALFIVERCCKGTELDTVKILANRYWQFSGSEFTQENVSSPNFRGGTDLSDLIDLIDAGYDKPNLKQASWDDPWTIHVDVEVK